VAYNHKREMRITIAIGFIAIIVSAFGALWAAHMALAVAVR